MNANECQLRDTDAAKIRVLLAEDDAISRSFLTAALRDLGLHVGACADGKAALDMARRETWQLLLLDYQLPGLTGPEVLARLQTSANGAQQRAPALAITAAPDENGATLLAAGFAEVLPKPITLPMLKAALQRHTGLLAPALDDAVAHTACGSPATVRQLRQLFLEQELPTVLHELDAHGQDLDGMRPTLHRLRAACGFCGATALAAATDGLQHALTSAGDRASAAAAFRDALEVTRGALLAERERTYSISTSIGE